jgi:hypothetical protein
LGKFARWGLIGTGRGLTASPLPHHRTFGSRIRRFGRLSQGVITPTGASSPGVPAASSSQRPSMTRPLAGCHPAAPQQATTLFHRSGLQRARARLLCRLLTSAGRSRGIAPPSVLCQDAPQISRGKPSYRLCISARFIKHSHLWMEDFAVACQLVPTVPHLISGSCPSSRTFAPRFLQTPPHGDALALHLSFGSTHTWTGGFHPQALRHARHTRPRSPALSSVRCSACIGLAGSVRFIYGFPVSRLNVAST